MLWRELKAWQVYGANTDVGKTILSTVLCKALARRAPTNGLLYLKPVSTGPDNEADDRHITRYTSGVVSKCVSQFADPVSPHLAARRFKGSKDVIQSDDLITSKVKEILTNHSKAGGRYALLETAGGVLSPGPSGTVQADLYRPLRLPTLLMGDSKLGGIATTISAFESLHLRGYDVESVLLFDDPKWGNHEYLQEHFSKHGIQSFALPLPPTRVEDESEDRVNLSNYYEQCSSSPVIDQLVNVIHQKHFTRVSKLTSMPAHAESIIWHPFRQYGLPQNIIAIDSAYGDHFETYNQESDKSLSIPESGGLTTLNSQTPSPSLLTPLFDASASWWTQGFGHGNPDLSLTAAHAAGRYGHVMFASAVHEPALDLSYNLLTTLKNPRLSRVFFTDNGSTGMEVAVKMALRATCDRYGWNKKDTDRPVGIIGLKGSYHGDTIGVMNCSEPSTFNEKVDWYQPWGHWFTPPEIRMKNGRWMLDLPEEITKNNTTERSKLFDSLDSIFSFDNREADAELYASHIKSVLTKFAETDDQRFGALIMEPLVMGAGGMIFVDPLFQRTLINTIRSYPQLINPDYQPAQGNGRADPTSWSGVPVIADEVFTGLYRLGRASSSSFLNSDQSFSSSYSLDLDTSPDISVHAKLLTGGLLPLALTTASESIFRAFLSDSKADALLHGHSYTAHAIGCSVANKSLEMLEEMNYSKGDWEDYKQAWQTHSSTNPAMETKSNQAPIFSFFSPSLLTALSHHEKVSSCFAIGTILVLSIKSEGVGGYSSNAAASLQARLMKTVDEDGRGVHSRVLGDVIYFMTSMTTKPDAVRGLEQNILAALDGEK